MQNRRHTGRARPYVQTRSLPYAPTGMNAMTNCPACDASLSRSDRESGWCDGCGKKLPESMRHGVSRGLDRGSARESEESGGHGSTILAVLAVVVLLPLILLFLLGMGGQNVVGSLILRSVVVVVVSAV